MYQRSAAPQTYSLPRQTNPSRCGNDIMQLLLLINPERAHMNKVAVMPTEYHNNTPSTHFSEEQVDILKNSICKGASNDEFAIFLMACQKTQLDPFMRQIYAVKRWDNRLKRETMTYQTGIDGYRLIAERTGRYCPGPKNTFGYDASGNLLAATAYVKKLTNDGTWHIVEAEAYFDEYSQTTTDKVTGEKKSIGMWSNMQRNQLAKCAESLALRKAFPAELSGVYTKEEMKQAEFQDVTPPALPSVTHLVSQEQIDELIKLLEECGEVYKQRVFKQLKTKYNIHSNQDIPIDLYAGIKKDALKKREDYQKMQERFRKIKEENELDCPLLTDEEKALDAKERECQEVYGKSGKLGS